MVPHGEGAIACPTPSGSEVAVAVGHRIDLYYLHSGTATDAPFNDQVSVLAELQTEGLIHHIGLSNVTVEQFEAAREIVDIAALTANYNLGARLGSAHLAAAERAGIVFSAPARNRWPSRGNCSEPRTPSSSQGHASSVTSKRTSQRQDCAFPWTRSES